MELVCSVRTFGGEGEGETVTYSTCNRREGRTTDGGEGEREGGRREGRVQCGGTVSVLVTWSLS